MRIFLTGSTGFIGSHFLKAALDAGHEVIALRRSGSRPRILQTKEPQWIEGELSDATAAWFEGVDVLVHLAAAGVSPQKISWTDAFQINVADSMALIVAAQRAGVNRYILCGTCMEYGGSATQYEKIPVNAPLLPAGPYASSKTSFFHGIQAFCSDHQLALTYLRPFTVYGPGQHHENLWPSLQKAAAAGEDFPMTLGQQVRDFVPVETVAQAFLRAAEQQYQSERCKSAKVEKSDPPFNIQHSTFNIHNSPPHLPTFPPSHQIRIANIGTGTPQTILEFAEHWWKTWNAKGKLLPGAIPYRDNEVMRYVPEITYPMK